MRRLTATAGSIEPLGLAALAGPAGAATMPNGGPPNMVNSHTWPGGMSNAVQPVVQMAASAAPTTSRR
jgi:hypothetical protein